MAAPEGPVLYQGVSRSSAAFRLLQQMGWQEGEGLGREKQGIKEHVRVTKKKDNSGVGVDAQQKAASNWTFNTAAFDSILKNLNVIVADKNEGDDKQRESVAHDAEDERVSLPKKATRPQGRYKKRELGKLLNGKSLDDLNAILGYGKSTTKEVWPTSDGLKAIAEKSSLSESSKAVTERLAGDDNTTSIKDGQFYEEIPNGNIGSDWWGTRYGFVRAGAVGMQAGMHESCNGEQKGLEVTELTKIRRSFCEKDQEDLYKLVQDKATKGRQGLGIADRPKKIGGAYWKGQKVILGTDNHEDAENDVVLNDQEKGTENVDVTPENNESNELFESMEGRLAKRRKREHKLKWKKFCRRLLQEAPAQTMKIKDLHRRIIELQSSDEHHYVQSIIMSKDDLKEKLIKSSKFLVEGKKVSLMTLS